MSSRTPPVDALVEAVRSAIHARRLKALAPADAIRDALEQYISAVEHHISRDFAEEHLLKLPVAASNPSPFAEASNLLALVNSLPELQQAKKQNLSEPQVAASAPPPPSPPPPPPPISVNGRQLSHLSRHLQALPLVIVGGVAHPERLVGLDPHLPGSVEWVETTRQGTHAIGNLERRIREGRICALLVVEGSLSHKHYDPLVAATRHVSVPCAYAGKGGKAALIGALQELDAMMARRVPS